MFINTTNYPENKKWMPNMRIYIVFLLILLGTVIARNQESQNQAPKLGGTINIFSRYGYLSISMRVVSRNDSNTWIFREPTLDGFYSSAPNLLPPSKTITDNFKGDFHMEFCDNIRQLLQAYFRDFIFERMERPWRAFTNSWSRTTIAKHLGINGSLINHDYCYVLIRVSRFRENATLTDLLDNHHVDMTMRNEANSLVVGDVPSTVRFIRNFGSHYITSYITGNSLYQVFVYSPQIYQRIKERLRTRGITQLSSDELGSYFSPWYAEHIGTIQSASGNRSLETWAIQRLRVHHTFVAYSTLLKLHGNVMLLRQLDEMLGNEALLQLHLRTLAPLFDDFQRREWFLEVIDNYSKLWEVNM
ncbi:hypothetical protein PV327_010030 [Microctonus hyperodae]|uniref:MACPF domain-containing protein n=1 Tax=Microctonus hyperodae TaxID=165561 RepID=A0AA39F279_MICHY|nr:hypothetical protein PV327_010030 [Microctonus hyperodae]